LVKRKKDWYIKKEINMKLHEETNRIKNLMRLDEQSNEDSFNEFSAGDFRNLKQFLTSNNELLDKLKPILKKETLDDVYSSLIKANKTDIIKGMSQSKIQKDFDLYKFLEIFLDNAESFY
jgi:hypothetical protein